MFSNCDGIFENAQRETNNNSGRSNSKHVFGFFSLFIIAFAYAFSSWYSQREYTKKMYLYYIILVLDQSYISKHWIRLFPSFGIASFAKHISSHNHIETRLFLPQLIGQFFIVVRSAFLNFDFMCAVWNERFIVLYRCVRTFCHNTLVTRFKYLSSRKKRKMRE